MKKRILILWTGLLAVALCACSSGGKTVTVAPEGSAPAETLMVGDRKYDAMGAAQNGVPFAAALYGFGSPEEFASYPKRFEIHSPAELAAILTGKPASP